MAISPSPSLLSISPSSSLLSHGHLSFSVPHCSLLPSRLSHGHLSFRKQTEDSGAGSSRWILNFDEDNICGIGSWIAPEDEEAILAPGMAPLLETKINIKKPKISNYAFGFRDGSSAGDALRVNLRV